ncbi:MAG: hypothetical protein Q4C06_08860 [Bacillota bacterium]|nr:hypothetical protein [Bacillota bacterium]
MIDFFNRKEICVTFDLNKQAEIRYLLQGEGIDYQIRTKNRTDTILLRGGTTRAYTGSAGNRQMQDYEYHIYVHRDDFERALYLLQEKKIR